MRENWARIVMLVVILFQVVVVAGCGESLLISPWGNVAMNVISDFFFAVGLTLFLLFLHQRMLVPAREFFGIRQKEPIQVFVSTHASATTTTQRVMTSEEYEAADEFRSLVKRQFPEFIASWARLLGIDVDAPEVVIKGSPLGKLDRQPGWGSVVLIGGPVRNSLSEFYLTNCDPWLGFDADNNKFVKRVGKGEQATMQELDCSDRLAMVQKLACNGTAAIIVFGFGEVETAAAVRYLAYQWKTLVRTHQSRPFARLLFVHPLGHVEVLGDYSDS